MEDKDRVELSLHQKYRCFVVAQKENSEEERKLYLEQVAKQLLPYLDTQNDCCGDNISVIE